MTTINQEKIINLKAEYVKYYGDVPVQRYAAMYVGRDEDTIIRWRNGDPAFAEAIQRARAEWVRKKVIATKAEFSLERLEKSVFSEKQEIEYSTSLSVEPENPNTPENKKLVDEFTEFMMAKTKRTETSP